MTSAEQLPDFLIIGAAKAATTSIHAYLSQHPDIFLPVRKETNFFAYKDVTPHIRGPRDPETLRLMLLKNAVTKMDEYCSLFRNAKNNQKIGEASPRYLYYERSPGLIQEILDDPKLIAILRNPVDRAYSHFLMNHRHGLETEESFDRALLLEKERIANDWSWDWHYMALGRYGEQLERYYTRFPTENIKVILYEQVQKDLDGVIADLFRFIGVDDAFQVDTHEVYHVASTASANDGFLGRLAFAPKTTWLGRATKGILPERLGLDIHRKFQNFVARRGSSQQVPKVNAATRAFAWQQVADDVTRLEKMLDLDLSAWQPQSDV